MTIAAAAMKATVAAIPAMLPIVDQANVDSSRPRNVSPRNSESRWPVISSTVACNSATVASSSPASVACRQGCPRFALRAAELGVGEAIGDAFEVAVDEAGVGLGLGAGRDLLVGVLDEVVASFFLERRLVREEDVLRRQLVADVVVGEVAAPREQTSGDCQHCCDDDPGGDQHHIDRAAADHHGIGNGGR